MFGDAVVGVVGQIKPNDAVAMVDRFKRVAIMTGGAVRLAMEVVAVTFANGDTGDEGFIVFRVGIRRIDGEVKRDDAVAAILGLCSIVVIACHAA